MGRPTQISPVEDQSFSLIRLGVPTVWKNPHIRLAAQALSTVALTRLDLDRAQSSWRRFAGLLARLFPEIAAKAGQIESELIPLGADLAAAITRGRPGKVLVKADHSLPVTGSIKARGAIYEVLCHAETLAMEAGLLPAGTGCECLSDDTAARLFSQHVLVVGSTGNLGFSVGVIGRALGFSVEVHVSAEAKAWKKERLVALGACVVEHAGDYSVAVAAARQSAKGRRNCHFVDDENSLALFLGYSSAAFNLAIQLNGMAITPTPDAPLDVFLPCGVGGAPAGITFGLKMLYGDAVRCVFVEPVSSPCMLVQLAAGIDRPASVYDIGLVNRTVADGLAVPRASLLAAQAVQHLLDAVVTVSDDSLLAWTARLWRQAGLRLEPSAAAGFAAVAIDGVGRNAAAPCARVVWTTGGGLLPDAEFRALLDQVGNVSEGETESAAYLQS